MEALLLIKKEMEVMKNPFETYVSEISNLIYISEKQKFTK